jgi:MFS family permease
MGETVYYPASMSMVGDYHGAGTRSRAMGIHQTSVYVGTIAGGFFAGAIGQRYGWRWSFLVFGGLGILLGIALQQALVEPRRGAIDAPQAPEAAAPVSEFLRTVGNTPTFLILLGAFVCSNFVAVVLLSWMPKFLYDKFHMGLAMAGLTATIFVQLASLVGSVTGGWLADHFRKRTRRARMAVQAVGVLCGAPFVVLCGLTRSVGMLVFALTAWGFFKGLYDSNIWASLFDVVRPAARGTACGVMNCMGWLAGGGSAPVVIGLIAQRESLGLAIALASVVYVASGILLIIGLTFFVNKDMEAIA